ncbi:hypothetical protein [Paenibacillus aceti]|uniref:Uncharacterized protein n=1 Tax=Paenibacillus aceti TaxID=1820010 RepID=A0ABQ1W3Z4_9BACL|nr:hypothetical protein [Paenibacillus aceti]GGG13492.1 hypothetical protein GCM10010913_39100 [Paenibacillus aceti]
MEANKKTKQVKDLDAAADMSAEAQTEDQVRSEVRYSKAQFLASQFYPGVLKDILAVVLEDGERYTKLEAEARINQFKHRGVK